MQIPESVVGDSSDEITTEENLQAVYFNKTRSERFSSVASTTCWDELNISGYLAEWNRTVPTINNLFSSYYAALQSGDIDGSDSEYAKLHQILAGYEFGAVLNNGNVLKALLAGLPFWGIPSVLASGPQRINPDVNVAAVQAFTQSLQNTEAVSSILLGSPYNISDYMTTETDLANMTACTGYMLQSALSLIMSDVPTFTSWAAHGLYSGPTSFNLPQPAAGITSAFTTYLVGETLSQSHFSATPTTKTFFKEVFQHSRTCTSLGDVCKDHNDKAFYWSQVTQMQYEINEPDHWVLFSGRLPVIEEVGYEATAYGLLEYIETSNVDMSVLFDGAYDCTLEGKAGGSAVNIDADGSLDVACLSSLPIYLSKGSSCPAGAVQVGGKCPFGFQG
ncbi:hypothetical protein HO133_008300 [Letharia lupina]|uniref:Uncharacterized protein n=1 Tax=Letharia lupina TaxID=560253 RepID=A0A8H6CNM1_9LECA|nr:uncharacterized protein HO133_008300 [Letharia lupina]KAF6226859.1 hypothetical protein HO133_008300 [Letharia lupina]